MGRRKTRQVHSVTVSRRQTPSNTESVCSGDSTQKTRILQKTCNEKENPCGSCVNILI
ncbi:unnamed protein product [Tenebrio molitor]|nr:unnamed protein product [Tenebrio molitor]